MLEFDPSIRWQLLGYDLLGTDADTPQGFQLGAVARECRWPGSAFQVVLEPTTVRRVA